VTQTVLCIAGVWERSPAFIHGLPSGIEAEVEAHDARVVDAFAQWARPGRISPEVLRAVASHSHVVYLVSREFEQGRAQQVAVQMLRAARLGLTSGGVALKCESSGSAWAAAPFLALVDSVERHAPKAGRFAPEATLEQRLGFWTPLCDAYTNLPIADGTSFYSCGMHLLGFPDVSVDAASAAAAFGAGSEASSAVAALLHTFCRYLLAEAPRGSIQSGQTFALEPTAPAFRIEARASERYESDDLFYNPNGYLQLTLA
jgi:hypothetical protein